MEPWNNDVNDLLLKYANGTITEPETEKLFRLIKEGALEGKGRQEADVLKKIYEEAFAEPGSITADASKRIHNRLMESLDKAALESDEQVTPVIPMDRRWRWYAIAAVILLTVVGGIYRYWQPAEQNQQVVQVQETAPKKTVTLTLPNGEQVSLDHRQGSVVKKGDFNVINDSGSLGYHGKPAAVEMHTLATPAGTHYRLQLPDGTEVWLNAASSITYPTAFTGNNRKVYITGEVYFDVVADKSKPFLVDINQKAAIEVLGTSFNVNAYIDEPALVTTLITGKIRLRHENNAVVLTPGQQADISDNKIAVTSNADTESSIAWKSGVFRFDHAKANLVLRQLARWYDVEIEYEGALPATTISGEINRESTLSQTIEVLNKLGLRTRAAGGKVIVAP